MRSHTFSCFVASFALLSSYPSTAFANSDRSIAVHGHRGARAQRPENTLPAFRYAIAAGADALEMDMAVTKDDVIVISHDPMLESPVCSSPDEQGKALIRGLTFAEVEKWDCGAVPNPKFPTQTPVPHTPMPTLAQVLDLAAQGSFLYNIETKSFPEHPDYTPAPAQFVAMFYREVQKRNLQQRVILQSFDWRTLREMKKLDRRIPRSALTDSDRRSFVAIAQEAEATIVSPYFTLVTPAKVQEAHQAGLQVVAWTANKPSEWDPLIAAQVDAIISDDPAALLAYLRAKGLHQ
ncbi:MAG: glycerophosphodiester phosphodiesterase [Rhodospirillales bacterium]|nr:glycerophosphodiester phosphodiesterase [Acetobacter sp.]